MRAEPLPDHWTDIVPRANTRAFLRLKAVVLNRGMTAAELAEFGEDADSDGYDWNLRLGVLFAFRAASRSDEDRGKVFQDEIDALLKELQTAELLVGGELWLPGVDNGRIGFGDETTDTDRFQLGEADSGRFPTAGGGTEL
jgi:hypothetical protein